MAKLLALTPMLWTKELEETIAFYTEILGFECAAHVEGWAVLVYGEVEIMFCLPNAHLPIDGPQFTGSFYFNTDNVDELWANFKGECNICYEIDNFDYGMREFAIFDNNNYILQFGQQLTP